MKISEEEYSVALFALEGALKDLALSILNTNELVSKLRSEKRMAKTDELEILEDLDDSAQNIQLSIENFRDYATEGYQPNSSPFFEPMDTDDMPDSLDEDVRDFFNKERTSREEY